MDDVKNALLGALWVVILVCMIAKAKRRPELVCMLCLTAGLFFCRPSCAQDDRTLEKCVLMGSVLPLIGEPNDTPLVRANLDGHDVAIFVSPEISKLIVRDVSNDFWFPDHGAARLMAQDHQMERANWTQIEDLRLGEVRIGPVPGLVIDPTFPKTIGDLPIIGIVGRNILVQGLIEMIDIPHRAVAFLRWDYDRCGPAANLLGPGGHVMRLSDDNAVRGTVSGRRFDIHFDPDLAYNTFPADNVSDIGITREEMNAFPKVNLRFSEINVGRLSDSRPVTLANDSIGSQQFLIQRRVSRVVLGSAFFQTRTVLFDFNHHQISYVNVPSSSPATANTGRFHFDMTYIPHAAVTESAGESGHVQH
ncbi:hypothetical protein JUN65_04420 [Gluconacetobacter azotocaptans]|uniref:hypothetical protein n=1 Tax=Gluconacetobacter azotocaptans TaxID=142834 RepID=UPI00195BB193|nr:hypothetical protein [Gluconacetobacter azotocaptans]MBM9400827.1 hypothetical protein [Gluconacetobacter azotocaptans]